jgi:hypothetical protein
VVGHCVQRRTCTPAVSVLGGDELRPLPSKTRMPLWCNLALRPSGKEEVDGTQANIPTEECNVVKEFDNERHRWTRRRSISGGELVWLERKESCRHGGVHSLTYTYTSAVALDG